MNLHTYVIRDNKSGIYQTPIFASHLAEVTRGLESAIKKEGIPFNTHTSDFELYVLGTYNPETGQHDLHPNPVHVINLIDLKQPTQPGA